MKKIMFNDKYGLTQAVLEGRKTMTRRVITSRLQSIYLSDEEIPWKIREKNTIKELSRYKISEEISVAQKYKDIPNPFAGRVTTWADAAGWENKMFVKAKDMPHCIRITDIKVERLQDISEEDCLKEGIVKKYGGYGVVFGENYNIFTGNPRDAFAALIDKVSGKGTWEKNPWVFVYDFELVK